MGELGGRDSLARVAHRRQRSLLRPAEGEGDLPAPGGEAEGVGQQVFQGLLEAEAVASDLQAGDAVPGEGDAPGFGLEGGALPNG